MEESEGGSGAESVHVCSKDLRRRRFIAAARGGFREALGRGAAVAGGGELGDGVLTANNAGAVVEAVQKCQQQVLQGWLDVSLSLIK